MKVLNEILGFSRTDKDERDPKGKPITGDIRVKENEYDIFNTSTRTGRPMFNVITSFGMHFAAINMNPEEKETFFRDYQRVIFKDLRTPVTGFAEGEFFVVKVDVSSYQESTRQEYIDDIVECLRIFMFKGNPTSPGPLSAAYVKFHAGMSNRLTSEALNEFGKRYNLFAKPVPYFDTMFGVIIVTNRKTVQIPWWERTKGADLGDEQWRAMRQKEMDVRIPPNMVTMRRKYQQSKPYHDAQERVGLDDDPMDAYRKRRERRKEREAEQQAADRSKGVGQQADMFSNGNDNGDEPAGNNKLSPEERDEFYRQMGNRGRRGRRST